METETEFIFLGSKITADGDYSHEIKRCLFLVMEELTLMTESEEELKSLLMKVKEKSEKVA